MATEEASTAPAETGSLAKWASWLAALFGLWVFVSPFVLKGSIGSGTAMWSNVVSGIVVLVLAAYGAYTVRTAAETGTNSPAEIAGWIAALAGLWILVSPFVLKGRITAGTAMASNVVVGIIALVLAGYDGYFLHTGG